MASAEAATPTLTNSTVAAAVEFVGVSKYFAATAVQANGDVSFRVDPGTVHAVIGENGAGKSTLMNMLYGIHQPDHGVIKVGGEQRQLRSPRDAIAAGVGMVHQHFRLVPSFTVAENVVLGQEPSWRLDRTGETSDVKSFLARHRLDLDESAAVSSLSVGLQQRVEITKLLWRDSQILILDEPTAVLTPSEADELFDTVRRLTAEGRTVLFITHKLREVVELSDTVTVMRGGRVVTTRPTAGTNPAELAELMVGRHVDLAADRDRTTRTPGSGGDRAVVCSVHELTVADERLVDVVRDVSLEVRAGEILGIAGVSGNGQSELIDAIAGLRIPRAGAVSLGGCDVTSASPQRRRDLGLGHIAEDRLEQGVSADDSVRDNVLPALRPMVFNRFGFLRNRRSIAATREIIDRYQIAGAHPLGPVRTLSGGNMQKVVIARELEQHPRFLIASQPTRGVDIGSIEYIHDLLRAAAADGVAILLVSVELDEIFALADRIAVMFDGLILADDIEPAPDSLERVGRLMGGAQ
jgi:simple sugar transport system ATP-binding protein